MVRLGIVDFDTSHVVEFTKRLNHVGVNEEQWVDGAKVVFGYAGTSQVSPERIPEYTKVMTEQLGVRLVEQIEEMLGKIDGVLIESVDGSVHYERAKPFLEAGVPTFIDKPFTCSLGDAQALAELAQRKGVPLFSSSSLRYALEVQELKAREAEFGLVVGADSYSPAPLHPRNPGLFHYGIHAVETLYALMGAGCEEVWCVWAEGAEVVTGLWNDGRIGTVRGTRKGGHLYGFTAFCEKAVRQSSIDTRYIYRELLRQIVKMFESGEPPMDIAESIEIVAFIEAAMESANNGGQRAKVRA